MSTRKVPGDPGAGLVELSLEDGKNGKPGKLIVQLFPPGREPVELRLDGRAAWDLGNGILDGATELLTDEGIDVLESAPESST